MILYKIVLTVVSRPIRNTNSEICHIRSYHNNNNATIQATSHCRWNYGPFNFKRLSFLSWTKPPISPRRTVITVRALSCFNTSPRQSIILRCLFLKTFGQVTWFWLVSEWSILINMVFTYRYYNTHLSNQIIQRQPNNLLIAN